MSVCLLINQLAPGGAPTLLLDIVRHTDTEANIDYTVCFIEGEDELAPDFEAAGARVVDFGAEFKFDPRAMRRMFRFFQREEFDVLHAHLPYSQTVGRVFGRLSGIENIVTTQHSAPNNYHPITRILERSTRSLDSRTIAVSKAVERLFTGDTHEYESGQDRQWGTIHNGIDAERFGKNVRAAETTDLKAEWGIGDGPLFLNVGRYVPEKSQHILIKAMTYVVSELPDAQLLIVGWGELKDDLQIAVKEHGLSGSIRITGRGSPIHPYYALADEFVLSSVRESFGIVLLEAMAAELPVVATNVQGIPEIVEHERTGLLAPPNAPKQLADAMVQAIRSDKSYGKQGYRRAAAVFDIRKTVSLHVQLYRELCGEMPESDDISSGGKRT